MPGNAPKWWTKPGFQPAEAELYQAGDTFYTKAYHGPGRGCYAGYPFHWVMLRGTGMATFCPDEEKAEAVYLPLTEQSAADVQNSLDKGTPYVIRVEICEDSGGDLKQLPDSARLLPVKTFCNLGVTADRTLRNHRMTPAPMRTNTTPTRWAPSPP